MSTHKKKSISHRRPSEFSEPPEFFELIKKLAEAEPEFFELINKLAEAENKSKTEFIVDAIKFYIDNT